MCNCLCSVIVLCGMMIEGREKVKPGAFSKSTKGAARLNVPIRRTNLYQQYYMPSQHTYCGRVWNLIQACDVQSSNQKVYISTPPSPIVEIECRLKWLLPDDSPGGLEWGMKFEAAENERTPKKNKPSLLRIVNCTYSLCFISRQTYFQHLIHVFVNQYVAF